MQVNYQHKENHTGFPVTGQWGLKHSLFTSYNHILIIGVPQSFLESLKKMLSVRLFNFFFFFDSSTIVSGDRVEFGG